MGRGFLLCALALALSGCGLFGERNAANRGDTDRPLPFDAELSRGEDRAFFVAVEHEGNGVEALRESVRFEATKYCLLGFGGSDADWLIDPATDDWAFRQDGRELIFQGECTAR